MNRPGIIANIPTITAPNIVPAMKAACVLTWPFLILVIAIPIPIIVQIVSRWIQLKSPSFISRIQNEATVTKLIISNQNHPTIRCWNVPFSETKFIRPRIIAKTAAIKWTQINIWNSMNFIRNWNLGKIPLNCPLKNFIKQRLIFTLALFLAKIWRNLLFEIFQRNSVYPLFSKV